METFNRVQQYLPMILDRNKTILSHLQKYEDGLQQCQQWFNEAKQIINRYSIQVPMKKIEEFLEHHRVREIFILFMIDSFCFSSDSLLIFRNMVHRLKIKRSYFKQ